MDYIIIKLFYFDMFDFITIYFGVYEDFNRTTKHSRNSQLNKF